MIWTYHVKEYTGGSLSGIIYGFEYRGKYWGDYYIPIENIVTTTEHDGIDLTDLT